MICVSICQNKFHCCHFSNLEFNITALSKLLMKIRLVAPTIVQVPYVYNVLVENLIFIIVEDTHLSTDNLHLVIGISSFV